jgi:hypothetical protein
VQRFQMLGIGQDENARIEAVVWKGNFARMRIKPEEGLEVIVTGRLTTYPGQSKYQIVIETLEPAGLGALMALVEERKKKLAAEGLFDAARKQLLPFLPDVIGVITSPTGAVIRDILHRLADRFPRHVLVWPVKVQGDGSAEQIAAAIRGFNALPARGRIRRPWISQRHPALPWPWRRPSIRRPARWRHSELACRRSALMHRCPKLHFHRTVSVPPVQSPTISKCVVLVMPA